MTAAARLEVLPGGRDAGSADADWLAPTTDAESAAAGDSPWAPEHQLVGALMWLPADAARPIVELIPAAAIEQPVIRWAYETIAHLVVEGRNPDPVLVDSEVIARAPKRFLVAGMGDARIGTPSGWLPLEAAVVERAREVCRRGRIRQVASRARLGLLCRAGEPFEARWGGGAGALETGGPTRPRGLRERSG